MAAAEARRTGAIAKQREMSAAIIENRALVVGAEMDATRAMARAFSQGGDQYACRVNIPLGSVADCVF